VTGNSLVYFPLELLITKKEERDILPVIMNINFCPLHYADESSNVVVVCPTCHSDQCPKHGCYIRKGFHTLNKSTSLPTPIQRHRCLNPECKRRTFSVLPPMVLRYCRFFWPCLQVIWNELKCHSISHIARIWNVDRRVIVINLTQNDRQISSIVTGQSH
jgi:hypothetical protein